MIKIYPKIFDPNFEVPRVVSFCKFLYRMGLMEEDNIDLPVDCGIVGVEDFNYLMEDPYDQLFDVIFGDGPKC